MIRHIIVACPHCNEKYAIENSKYEHMRESFIMFAVCPYCHKPRNPNAFVNDAPGRCERCQRPVRKGYRLCHAHYVSRWRKGRKSAGKSLSA